MDKAPDSGRRGQEKRTFSIERHMRRADGLGPAMGLGALTEVGELGTLVADIRALREEVRALREQMDARDREAPGPAPVEPQAEPTPEPAPEPAHHHGMAHDDEEAQLLRIEVARMVRSLATAKREIAEIKHPMAQADDDRMVRAASELDAIVAATERATNSIMDAAEAITGHCDAMLTEVGDTDLLSPRLHDMSNQAALIFEACNFQDITGQRITKVVKTLEFIEDRIRAIVEEWGRDAFLDLPLPQDDASADEESRLLNGPQLENQGLSQDDIDSLFG
ncbi:protein phosphatase CheZ [Roseospira visakhapatnamensis]|uniref:Chemotaxis protein CheZ n=1 Tax=Roseospira visakhapatnamensis TaxID=390880 RepID=A0A7W6W9Z1_9PROT|nr:protein phosphatase CheZ [Roseospira visakhapatnamensis]MBB4266645.1 chemotaxis protein CheZ [Roseospira visakhapatnamensis]